MKNLGVFPTKTQVQAEGVFRNPDREAARIECELARRMRLLGIRPDDSAAMRRFFDSAYLGNPSRQQDSMESDLLGLGLVIVKLIRTSSSAGSDILLEPATRAFVEAMFGMRAPNQ